VEKLQVLIDGGKATPGPPLGPALGPLGVNIVEILKAINEKTKSFEGMKVPVTLLVDPKTKTFSIEVGTPPTSALITKELKIEKGRLQLDADEVHVPDPETLEFVRDELPVSVEGVQDEHLVVAR